MATLPWDRSSIITADMFGELGDNPLMRRARQLEAERLQAEAEYEARAAQPRAWETPQSISSEVFSPLSSAFGIDQLGTRGRQVAPAATRQPPLIHAGRGSSVLRQNPITGEVEEVWSSPPAESKQPTYEVPLRLKFGEVQEKVRMTADEIRRRASEGSLPTDALASETVKLVLSQPAQSATTATPIAMPAAAPARESFGFIGEPGYNNAFDSSLGRRNPFDEGFSSVRDTSPAPTPAKPSGGIKILSVKRRQ